MESDRFSFSEEAETNIAEWADRLTFLTTALGVDVPARPPGK